MDNISTLLLFILAVLQALLTILHVSPGVGLPISQTFRYLSRNTASRSVIFSFIGALTLLSAASLYELSKGSEKIRPGNHHGDVMALVDYLRAQVSCALSLSNLLIMLLNLILSSERCKLDFAQTNLSAMARQVKGLQAEYFRATSAAAASEGDITDAGLAAEEAAALKKTLNKLIAEKQQLQGAVEVAEAAAKTADARVTAMVSQVKGYDKEIDRLRDENNALRLQMQRAQPPTAATAPAPNKKDD